MKPEFGFIYMKDTRGDIVGMPSVDVFEGLMRLSKIRRLFRKSELVLYHIPLSLATQLT